MSKASETNELPLVAVVGRPNVGKSTLYNRLVGGRPAMVEDTPGVTRDRRYGEVEFGRTHFRIVDTGGLDPTADKGVIQEGIHRQAWRGIEEADLIVFVVDAREGLTSSDRDVAERLRSVDVPIIVVANKVDEASHEANAAEAYELGLGDVIPMSATHGRGARELLDTIQERLAELEAEGDPESGADAEAVTDAEADAEAEAEVAGPVRFAFVGRPNVGKSSLVNRLLGEERVLVHDMPGTTTDPVDTPFEFLGEKFVLVDTAGIRRRARIEEPTEKISVSMALGQIQRADVAALVIDATQGPAEQDARIGGAIDEAGRGCMIVVNKIDLLADARGRENAEKKLRERIRDELPFLSYAPIYFVSAQSGSGVTDLIAGARKAWGEHGRRITTSELNRFFELVCETHPPPTFRSKAVRIHYVAQVASHPPTFVLWANRPELVHHAYRRYLANQLRERFGFEGTPLRILTRRKKGS